MSRKYLFLVFLLIASLFAFGGCGDDEDGTTSGSLDDLDTSANNTNTNNPSTNNPSTNNPSTNNPSTNNPSTNNPGTNNPNNTNNPAPVCGDGVVDTGETCDDGNTASDDGCSATCQLEGSATCGDGVVEGAESCDGDALNGQDCSSQGFTSGDLTCSNSCSLDFSACVFECIENTVYPGQAVEDVVPDAESRSGGVLTTTPWDSSYDAGLAELLIALPDDGIGTFAEFSIAITGATVIGTSFGNFGDSQFWIADGNVAIKVDFDFDDGNNPDLPTNSSVHIRVGQKISFTATGGLIDFGVPKIVSADGATWSVDSEGNEVYIEDKSGVDIVDSDVNKNIRVTGTIVGEGVSCGGSSSCFALDYGGASTIELRANATILSFLGPDRCITFAGPVSFFNAPQLNVVNFDWIENNFSE